MLPGLLFYTMTHFCATLPATYLPLEMQKRALGSDATGTILASYMWASAGSCLIAPYLYRLKRVKLQIVTCACVFLLASCSFSFIFHVPDKYIQVTAVIVRVVQGVSGGLIENFQGSAYITIYSRNIGMISGLLEISCDVGYLSAPVIGALIYERYGFVMTQLLTCAVITAIFVWLVVSPDFDTTQEEEEEEEDTTDRIGFTNICRSFPMMMLMTLPVMGEFVISVPTSFLATLLHDDYGYSTSYTGFVFLGMGAAYVAITPVIGYLSDMEKFNPFIMTALAPVLLLCALFTMSVSRLIRAPITYTQILLGYTVSGFAAGVGNGPMLQALIRAWHYTNPGQNSPQAYSFITSFMLLTFPVGEALGTTIGGFLYEKIGFLLITELQVAMLLLYSAAMILFVLTYGRKINSKYSDHTMTSSVTESDDISPLIKHETSIHYTNSDTE